MNDLLKSNYMKYGLLLSGVMIACLLYMELSGQNLTFDDKPPLIAYLVMIAQFILAYLGINERKQLNKGKLTFKQGVGEGFRISLVYAATSVVVFLIYYLLINPSIVASIRAAYGMIGASDAMVITVDMIGFIITAVLFGTLTSAIISFFLKSKKK